MKPAKASLRTAPAVLHTLRERKVLHAAQPRFIFRHALSDEAASFHYAMKHLPSSFHFAAASRCRSDMKRKRLSRLHNKVL